MISKKKNKKRFNFPRVHYPCIHTSHLFKSVWKFIAVQHQNTFTHHEQSRKQSTTSGCWVVKIATTQCAHLVRNMADNDEDTPSWPCDHCDRNTGEITETHRFYMPKSDGIWYLHFVNLHPSCITTYKKELK